MKSVLVLLILALSVEVAASAQEIAGRWSCTADTVDASGVKRMIPQTIEIRGMGSSMTGMLVSRRGGAGIPLRVIQEGPKFTLLGDFDFEGGEHLRWYLELKEGRLQGKVWALHDAPKKWGVDWTGPVDFGRETAAPVDRAGMDRWMKELSNWGRWGATDQMGAVNLITPETRRAAAALVHEGFSVSLSRDADRIAAADNSRPFGHKMISSGVDPDPMFAMDSYTISFHGAALTHMDAMSHMVYAGKTYNGYSQSEIDGSGAHQLAVDAYRSGFFGRGILIDIPRLKGVPYLELSTPIYPADLDAWEKQTGIRVGRGDMVFVRTGRWARRAALGPWDTDKAAAGLHVSCARWFKERDIAVLGSDAHGEMMPSSVAGVAYPIHQLVLIAMGVPMFDNCDLEALSQAAAARKRWEFLLTAAPLVVPLGTGSPLNPIATF